ncbi:unnamed protein product [Blepharisma stoltei]|uniref:Uncharacterized protein n=1 Tax=Blepharisma stoltei TaxID=1481888 RepID=A0AAU9IHE3_9CILI|nr:unnamed protein product [Blepharisma stoltei]
MGCSASLNATNPRLPHSSINNNSNISLRRVINLDKPPLESSPRSPICDNVKETHIPGSSKRSINLPNSRTPQRLFPVFSSSESITGYNFSTGKVQEEKCGIKDRLDVDINEEDNSDNDYSELLNNCEFYHEDILHEFLEIDEVEVTAVD